ncbi:alpha/beta hydrolase [Duganella dendranthematis]|jgi:pimeloyl-ACP methyl ester carboxylesterase|uniref:Alpha/beta hydrolase n=1 Tax=Duganella dendranthematis TaxID=2728021 RepID=A0ABX6MHR9_9BURK|nr:alpha/beta hydrolase [Duganella dendranthematis]QJD93865.1 alpha/beta hydrolase [Duganella dendranthematis]
MTTQYITVNGIQTAYRLYGVRGAEPPLFLMQHFTGTMDNWDPLVIEGLARHRQVVVFDNAGVGASHGITPSNVPEMAQHALSVIEALGLGQVDLLGFSLGSFLAQEIAANLPKSVRRMVLVGGCPQGQGAGDFRKVISEIGGKTPGEILLHLFFTPTANSQQRGKAFLQRLKLRDEAGPNPPSQTFTAQYLAIESWCGQRDAGYALLKRIKQPVLVVQGSNDTMFPTEQSIRLFQHLPNAQLSLYPDAGHASLFQYPSLFVEQVDTFLRKELA